MSPSSQESKLSQLREALAQSNSELFLTIAERRQITVLIQDIKTGPRYDPERELELFKNSQSDLKHLSIKELLAFSLIMEDQAMAMAPGSYPSWSLGNHLTAKTGELSEMINPLLLKVAHPSLFSKLTLTAEFKFLYDLGL
jgi:chorismate mutase